MRTRTMWLACLLAAGLALPSVGRSQEAPTITAPAAAAEPEAPRDWWVNLDCSFNNLDAKSDAEKNAEPDFTLDLTPHEAVIRGQNVAPPDPDYPLPISSTRPEQGFFIAGEFTLWRQTNPLHHQIIGYRGFIDVDGSVTAALNGGIAIPNTRYGSFAPALDAQDAGGPGTYVPGFKWIAGWRFENGATFEVSWQTLLKQTYSASANIIPPNFEVGQQLENTFITAPVFNFPTLYSGPANKVSLGNPFAVYGIWNGATQMQIFYTQTVQIWEAKYRQTIFEDECWRMYGMFGPREVWLWDRFMWRTVDVDVNTGQSNPLDVGIYNNIVSQHFWGVFVGMGNEYWLGNGFSISLDITGAGYINYAKERATWELGQKFGPRAKRNTIDYTLVPEVEGQLNLWWYPIDGVECRLGYNGMAFFNTIASQSPVDFNFGAITPAYNKGVIRTFDGLNAGLMIHF